MSCGNEKGKRKDRNKGKEKREEVQFSTDFPTFEHRGSKVKKRAGLRSKRYGFSPTLVSPCLRAIRWP